MAEVERLLEQGVNAGGHVETVRALLEAVILGDGGDRHVEIVRLLIGADADAGIPDGARERGYDSIARVPSAR